MSFIEQYLLQLNTEKRRWRCAVVILTVLSLIVALVTVWNLRMTGVTIANGASCGCDEHMHTEECLSDTVLICGLQQVEAETDFVGTEEPVTETQSEEPVTETQSEEPVTEVQAEEPVTEADGELIHVHTESCYEVTYSCGVDEHTHKISCYSDPSADVETAEIWEATLPELTGNINEDILLIARSQLGYTESERNYTLAEDSESKLGITRYGQWYGNPYGDWANMFTSFCLRYAGVSDDLLNSGAEVMQHNWEQANQYRGVGNYLPTAGDIVFLDKNQNGTAETTAVVVSCLDGVLTVIEGDTDNKVSENAYPAMDNIVVGYGISAPQKQLMMFAAAPTASGDVIGSTVTYNTNLLTQNTNFIIYTSTSDGKYYAIDGDGKAVEIQIDSSGTIYADVSDQNSLYWTFEKANNYDNRPAYYIKNVSTAKYVHPNRDSSTYGPMHPDKWESALYTNGSGVRIRGARQDAYVQLSGSQYTISNTQNNGSTMYFGKAPSGLNLWLDGTNGNLMSCRGSDNTRHTVYSGIAYTLPSQWKSPQKYNYKLAGWVNIETGDYYLPGSDITITKDTVLYADWVAATYDIGQYNSFVTNTVSTKDFITTKVFDYSSLINLLSSKVSLSVSGSSHSETWSHVSNGNVSYKGQPTLNFSFNDHDGGGTLSNLNSLNDPNKYTGGNGVYSGIYNATLGDALFSTDNLFNPETGEGIVGKHYLGEGDHLFQINTDPSSEYYGYYYYDAKLNAASYNKTDQRFYVYDYLARTSDSANNNDEGRYSDFLPLNSPYANTNGQTVKTYNYDGDNAEYQGVSHYVYDARYDSNGSEANQIISNLWFGMRTDVQFGLPDTPGQKLTDGTYGNKDVYGNDMVFKFTGDDDVWVLVDGKVVLDLGGIHQASEGEVNFSTGKVTVEGKTTDLKDIAPGEHTLSILYLERGSSMSNCAIYFNLAPRFSLTLEKEDVLTQEILNGAQFAVYSDLNCTVPCDLWTSQQSYKNGDAPTSVFTITDGKATIWGFSPSRTYYIKEVKPPDSEGYEPSLGVIQLTLDKNGVNSDGAVILEGPEGQISHGFTVHGFKIDEENQAAYLVITNAQNWVSETTSVYVQKKWADAHDHTYDSVTVYLNVTDADGTVRRIREIILSKENNWEYLWVNLPKYNYDAQTGAENKDDPVRYSVSEAYIPGYSPQISQLQNGTVTEDVWNESATFKNGEVYLLKTNQGFLSSQSASTDTLCFVDEATAKSSPLALWTATVSNNLVRLTNQAGQSLNFNRDRWYFNATANGAKMNLTPQSYGTGLTLASSTYQNHWYTEVVYMSGNNNGGYLSGDGNNANALILHPLVKQTSSTTVVLDGYGYSITNTPLSTETSLKVTKQWDYQMGDMSFYEKEQVTIRLLANGVDTGRTETVSLKTNWTAVFNGLPYVDNDGNPIVYTVVETWNNEDWIPIYAPITTINGNVPSYETTVTNTYRWTGNYELPGTGGIGTFIYILFGLILVVGPFVYGFSLRRKNGRKSKK